MTDADQKVEAAADKLEEVVQDAERSGGLKAKVAKPFEDDPDFLRKMKPSLIAARAKGESPVEPRPSAPSGPQLATRKKKASSGPSPWAVIGAALATGYVLAKVMDWRGHAHPRL